MNEKVSSRSQANPPRLSDVEAAYQRIRSSVTKTPVLTCATLNQLIGAELFFKCENFQKGGAFKMRGAANAVLSLSSEESKKGVATHSSGNHGQALTLAARLRGIPAYIVMPNNTPAVKKAAIKDYGGQIAYCEPTLQAREETLNEIVARTGASFIHPYDDVRVICGQGTVTYEFLTQVSDLDLVIAPVGGGGLLSGTALVAKSKLGLMVYGAEPTMPFALIGIDDFIPLPTRRQSPMAFAARYLN
jgi:threonine dehydratase